MKKWLALILIIFTLFPFYNLSAQEAVALSVPPSPPVVMAPEQLILKHVEEELKEKYRKELYIPPSIQSLIFTPAQQSILREARNGFNMNVPSAQGQEVVSIDPNNLQTDSLAPPGPSVRTLSLGGIIFLTPDDWTIWLNKKRITASNLPKEAIDLRVYKDFIELRWFDAQTNQIFPIRLRANQTFSLDAKTFIPG